MELTIGERVAAYNDAFSKYPVMWCDKNWAMGIWVLGNMYKRANGYYGVYPGNYFKRALTLVPDRSRTLHLFSGTLVPGEGLVEPQETTVDCQVTEHVKPSVVANARQLPFEDGAFDCVLADPPYSAQDAEKYGTPMVSRRHVLAEVARTVEPGGLLLWLDTVRPMYSAKLWKQVGAVAVLVSTNTRTRCLSIFERVA